MNTILQAYLRLTAPDMPPEVAWPLMKQCESVERMEDLPPAARLTINSYLPQGVAKLASSRPQLGAILRN